MVNRRLITVSLLAATLTIVHCADEVGLLPVTHGGVVVIHSWVAIKHLLSKPLLAIHPQNSHRLLRRRAQFLGPSPKP